MNLLEGILTEKGDHWQLEDVESYLRQKAERAISSQSLYGFSRLMFKKLRHYRWMQAAHHPIICRHLEAVFQGKIKRLIINIPPRYSKTELAVVNFIAWCLAQYPDCEFITTSYSARLAASNSWKAREIVASEPYKILFPHVALRVDSSAKDEWRTTAGGCVYATGGLGTITGYGAGKHRPEFGGAIIIDDPHKADEARSDTMRANVIEWYQGTLQSRVNSPDTPIILIMQRLHEEDLAGWLLAGGSGEEWTHLCLPAIQEDGTALWPEKHTIEVLRRMEQVSPYHFAGQYLQRPTPPEGGTFKPDLIDVIDERLTCIQWVRGWDIAASDGDGDWTVGALLGKLPTGRLLIADVERFQGRPDVVETRMKATALRDGKHVKISIPQDPGAAGKFQAQYLARALAGYSVHVSPEAADKVSRAEPLASQVNMGNVSMLRGDWNTPLISEMRNFPFGKHDDQVDALSRSFNYLHDFSGGFFNITDDVLAAVQSRPRGAWNL
jgi:predicted phage terminase large subunit-like protein